MEIGSKRYSSALVSTVENGTAIENPRDIEPFQRCRNINMTKEDKTRVSYGPHITQNY